MRHRVELAGFEGQTIEIDAGLFRKTLWVDGQPAPKAGKMGQYLLRRNDGREVTTQWPTSFDPAPSIVVDGKLIRTAPPLAWYEWLVVGAPLLLVFVGGALGAVLGVIAATLNAKIVRSNIAVPLRYLASLAIALAAAGVYVLVAGALHLALRR